MKLLNTISRVVLGVLFVFSGFVKALDPLGFAYKFSDYFQAFGLSFLDSLSLALGVFVSGFELVLGLVLLLGYQKSRSYWVLLVFMSFFTILTFILALSNPVTDCGCFGDAIIMTNWQTFFKNLIFMVFVLILFQSRKKVKNVLSAFQEKGIIILLFVASFMLSIYGLRHLPVLDFRPYSVGININESMIVPEGAEMDLYETILLYKNLESGNTEEFTIENYPQDTLKYSFVTSESKLLKKGYEPPIHDFGVLDSYGFEVTDEILSFDGYSLFMTSSNLDKADENILLMGNQWLELERFSNDFKFIPITAASSDVIDRISIDLDLKYKFYSGDEIMLKTMIRSNPGFIMIKNGTILAKWSYRDFPPMENWNSKWPELIQQFMEEQDPEIMMLIEEGFMDDLNWDMIDFDETAHPLLMKSIAKQGDKQTWIIFIFSLVLLLFIANSLSIKKR